MEEVVRDADHAAFGLRGEPVHRVARDDALPGGLELLVGRRRLVERLVAACERLPRLAVARPQRLDGERAFHLSSNATRSWL
jgi:hypothetical protein